jgi:hypothetical protein
MENTQDEKNNPSFTNAKSGLDCSKESNSKALTIWAPLMSDGASNACVWDDAKKNITPISQSGLI